MVFITKNYAPVEEVLNQISNEQEEIMPTKIKYYQLQVDEAKRERQ